MSDLTLDELRRIMTHLDADKAAYYFPFLTAAMDEGEIDSPLRMAAFLAQLAHESAEFRYMEEIASGNAYEGRADLGNINPGDGKRFKGRGPIQLTGRRNYRACGQALGIDLENHPFLAADAAHGFRVAAWFWTTHHLNTKADAGDFDGITRAINGGINGKANRDRYYVLAKDILTEQLTEEERNEILARVTVSLRES